MPTDRTRGDARNGNSAERGYETSMTAGTMEKGT